MSIAHPSLRFELRRGYVSAGAKDPGTELGGPFARSILAQHWVIKPSNADQLSPTIRELVRAYPSVIRLPIQWGSQDTFGHVNNVSYLTYFESGRMDYAARLGQYLSNETFLNIYQGKGIGIIVKHLACKYKQVVEFPDSIVVATQLTQLERDRGTFESVLISEKTGKVAAESKCQLVCYDYTRGTKADFPQYLLEAITRVQVPA
ncbi:hypothetical protein IWQ60_011980 [Tieghemiomyces parasiticus]|uniref:Thioesterase domain-containing protein n=1 Tax=Tieghemiomyces parasiticus TaxID=78921 RepID=A0A9W7ZQY5_9FUNG|nr:hypothetical protein IWQ60_011980 [Tieghemiomyces parasiticus]